MALREGEMLIAQTDGLYRAPYRPGQTVIPPESLTRLAALPPDGGHNSRTVRLGPDGRVYVSLGISKNCSDEYLGADYPFEQRRGGVLVLREDGAHAAFRALRLGAAQPGRLRLAARDRGDVCQQQRAGPPRLRAAAGILQPSRAPVRFTACPGSSTTGSGCAAMSV